MALMATLMEKVFLINKLKGWYYINNQDTIPYSLKSILTI